MCVFHISQWRGNSLLSCRIVPSARRRPCDFHRVSYEGRFNGPFVFCARLASVEASKQRGSDNTINLFCFVFLRAKHANKKIKQQQLKSFNKRGIFSS